VLFLKKPGFFKPWFILCNIFAHNSSIFSLHLLTVFAMTSVRRSRLLGIS